jgi:excinuclease ABC subunit C
MCIQAFFIRGGQNWGHRSFFPRTPTTCPRMRCWRASSSNSTRSAAAQAVLLDRELIEGELLAEALSEQAGRKVTLKAPQRGEQRG